MINVILCCAAGLSTSMMVSEIKDAAKKENVDIHIEAIPESNLKYCNPLPEIILLGPQLSYRLDDLKNQYVSQGIKVDVISMMDYGMLDGNAVLKKIRKLKGEK